VRIFDEGSDCDKYAVAEFGGCWLVDVGPALETILLVGEAYLLVDAAAAARGIDRGSPTSETTLSGPLVVLWLALVSPIDPEMSYTCRT
jgi:hypothetical protein